jgi:hypothetical protein
MKITKNCPYCYKNYNSTEQYKKYAPICSDKIHRFGYHDFIYLTFFTNNGKYFCSFYDGIRYENDFSLLENEYKIVIYIAGTITPKIELIRSKDNFKSKEDFDKFLEMAKLLE